MTRLLLTSLGAASALALGYVAWFMLRSDELRSKPEWNALQNLEYIHRQDRMLGLEFGTNANYVAVAVRSRSADIRIWILLNPNAEPRYKQLPEGDFALSREQFEMISTRPDIDTAVVEILRKHVGD